MIRRRQGVTRKVSLRVDDPPRWQKYAIFEKQLLSGSIEYNNEIKDMWKTYEKDGLDVIGLLKSPSDSVKKPSENYYNTKKKYDHVYEYDLHFNRPFIPDFKVKHDRIKPWREILTEISKEEDERAVKASINRTYFREKRFTDNFLEPMHMHANSVAGYKYRARTGVFPELDKYRALGSYTENMTSGCTNPLAKYGL